MPSGPRIRTNGVFGAITDDPLTIGAGSFNSPGLADLDAVSSAHAVVTLDPLKQFGDPEIVVITNHSPGATVASIDRGQYGTTARAHPEGTLWAHVPVDEDYIEILTSGTRPGDPYAGQLIFETDTDAFVYRDAANSNWRYFGDVPACRVNHNVTQLINDNLTTTINFNTSVFDTDNMHDPLTNNSRITFNTAGIYEVKMGGRFDANNDYNFVQGQIRLNGTTLLILGPAVKAATAGPSFQPTIYASNIWEFAVGDYVEARIYQDNIANAARNLLSTTTDTPMFSAVWVGRI